jgi:hypothetical protein
LDTKFNLILPKTSVMDSAGRKLLKDDTVTFRTKKDIDYGEIRIRAFNLDLTRKPVLLMFQGDALKYSFPFGNKKEIRKLLFKPGDYELRILFDTNGNGKWDAGQFLKSTDSRNASLPSARSSPSRPIGIMTGIILFRFNGRKFVPCNFLLPYWKVRSVNLPGCRG